MATNNMIISIVTNIAPPYRVKVWNALSLNYPTSLRCIFLAHNEANRDWNIDKESFEFKYDTLPGVAIKINSKFIHLNLGIISSLKRAKSDVIITTGYNPAQILAAMYALINGIPHIAMTDGTIESENNLSPIHRAIRKFLFKHTKAFIGASNGSIRLFKKYGINETAIFKSHLCANNELFRKTLKNSTQGNRRYDLIFSGRFDPIKNPLFAIDVGYRTSIILNRKISLLCIGSGQLLSEMQSKANQYKQHLHVDFAGFLQQESLPHAYASAKILLFPTAWDPWGIVANEACAAGTPTITTPMAGCSNEIIIDAQNGYILPLDEKVWSEHCAKLLIDNHLWESFSRASLTAVKEYTYENAAKGIYDAACSALGNRNV
ncbi:glycosyltransferase [Burkholderiaceae bacterium DAT-1]|nr:glycosyltransferase [Burkholderiaceae bacterium DAT-1]